MTFIYKRCIIQGGGDATMRTITTSFLTAVLVLFFSACASKRIVIVAPGGTIPTTTLSKEKVIQVVDCSTVTNPAEHKVCVQKNALIAMDIKKQEIKDKMRNDPYEQKARQILSAEPRAVANSQMHGCPSGSVWVNPNNVIGMSNDIVHTFFRGNYHSIMATVNLSKEYVDIEQIKGGVGLAVRNLCPGGSVVLSHYMNFGGYDVVQYRAVARDGKGRAAVSLSPLITMNSYYGYNNIYEYSQDWNIIF